MRYGFATLIIAVSAAYVVPASARVLTVGPGKTYAKPSLAAAAAQNGDTINIDAVVYESDACTWDNDNLVIRVAPGSAGKRAHLKSNEANAQGKGIWVIDGKNTTIDGIEFSGAKVADENGAGIRQEGPGVIIRNCYFHDNENGILGMASEMVIEFSEFNHNGVGEVGRTHNIYVDEGTSFTFRHCNTHHAVIGHNLKTRAAKNFILYNRIIDSTDGTASYEIDMPNGGFAIIMGNIIQQGPETDNPMVFTWGEEGLKHPLNEVYVINNTFINDRTNGGTFISLSGTATASKVMNNLFVGPGTAIPGNVKDTGGNVITQSPAFVDRAGYNYHILAASPAVDKGKDAGSAGGMSLSPNFQYVHPLSRTDRTVVGKLDAGAYEFGITESLKGPARQRRSSNPVAAPGLAAGPDHFLIPIPEGGWGYDMVGARLPAGY